MNSFQKYQLDYTENVMPKQTHLPFDYGLMIGENEPVRLLDLVLEEVDFNKVQGLYSSKGRKPSVPPKILCKLMIFAMMEGVYSTRAIHRQCQVNLQYKWLLDGYSVPSHMAFQRLFTRLTLPVVEDLFVQVIDKIEQRDSINFKEAFIDGTKLEANANRYTFVWRKSVEKHMAKLPAKLDTLKADIQRQLGEDMSCFNDEMIYQELEKRIKNEKVAFVHGKGKRKTVLQRLFERADNLLSKRLEYERHLGTMGTRNSYSKIDHDATFMRMKDDHMKNGQLKAGYNIQVAAHSEYILGLGIYPNPTDTLTLIPFLKDLERIHGRKFEYIVADAGYDSEENYTWLAANNYKSCIKPQNYERSKTRKWQNAIGRAENMEFDPEVDIFTCAAKRALPFSHISRRKTQTGFVKESRIYQCENCSGCQLRLECQPPYKGLEPKNNKRVSIPVHYNTLQQKNKEVFLSPLGTQLRINRSIQVEGVFGILKQDYDYHRLRHRGAEKVYKEMYLVAIGFNLQKLHNRNMANRLQQRLFSPKDIA